MTNRCMFTQTKERVNGFGKIEKYQEQCKNKTNKILDPNNNNRVYCDEVHQAIVDKINKEKFKGYVKIEKIYQYLDKEFDKNEHNKEYSKNDFIREFNIKLEKGEFE